MPTADQYAREYARRNRQPTRPNNNYTVTYTGTQRGNSSTTRSSADQVERSQGFDGSTGYRSPYEGYQENQYRAAQNAVQPYAPSPYYGAGAGGGGGGGGGGGYGGGGSGGRGAEEMKADAMRQMAFIMDLLKGGQFNAPTQTYTRDQALYDRLNQGLAADRQTATGAYDSLDKYLGNMGANPYATQQRAQGPQADLSMLNLLQSQGVDSGAYKAEADFLAQTGQGAANSYNSMLDQLAAVENASRQSRGVESQQARNFAQQEIDAQGRGLNTALDMREQQRRQQIEDANMQRAMQSQQQRLEMFMQLSQLAAQYGLPQPTMEQLGITAAAPAAGAPGAVSAPAAAPSGGRQLSGGAAGPLLDWLRNPTPGRVKPA